MRKKFIMICCFILLFLLVGTVSATDLKNETDSMGNVNFTNPKPDFIEPQLITDDLEMYYKDGSKFQSKVIGNYPEVIFTINGVNYHKEINNEGYSQITLNLNPGEYKITTTLFTENKTLSNVNTIKIKEVNTTLESEKIVNLTYKSGKYTVTLKGGNNKPLANMDVLFTINNVKYSKVTDENGQASLNINLNPGKYQISAVFKENGYYKASSEIKSIINVLEKNYILKAEDLAMEYKNGKYQVKLLNELNNPIEGETVELKICGKSYYKETNEEGIASLNINLNPGKYPIVSVFKNNEVSKLITVNKVTYSIKSVDLNVTYNDFSYYYIELRKNGDNLINKTIKTSIYKDNKMINEVYSATFENGLAKFMINETPGKYLFKSTCVENNYENIFSESIVEIKKGEAIVTSKDLKLNRKGEYYTVTLKDKVTDLAISNQLIKIKINGKTYLRTTDNKGKAKLAINLNDGEYLVEYEFDGGECFNQVKGTNTVLRTSTRLSTELEELNNSTSRKGEGLYVKLTDENGIELKNKEIEMIVSNKIYRKITDENGIAKLNINLNDGIYSFTIRFNGDSLFKESSKEIKLNVNKTANFNYSFNISTVKHTNIGNFPVYRYITVEINDNIYHFVNDNAEGKIELNKNYNYFLSLDTLSLEKINKNREITSQGILIEYLDENIVFTYFGQLKNLTGFSIIYDESQKYHFEKVATLILNDNIEAKIYFSEYYYAMDTFEEMVEKGISIFGETEDIHTVLNAYGMTHERVINLDFDKNYKTVQSYAIKNNGNVENDLKKSLENYMNFNKNYDKVSLETYLISLYNIWALEEFTKVLSNNFNCSWSDKLIVQTTSDWNGYRIHSMYDLDVEGNENETWAFKNVYGFLFSYCEQLALELSGREAISATSEVFDGFKDGKEIIFNQTGELLIITTTNSTSEIIINLTSGDTKALLGLNIEQMLKNFKYKGGASMTVLSYAYPNDFMHSYYIIKNGFDDLNRNVVNFENINSFERFIGNELRLHKTKILSGIQAFLTYTSPKAGGLMFATLQVMIASGEYIVDKRNTYASNETYQYFAYHTPIYEGKTIAVLNKDTGYTDYVEIPYKENGDYDLSKGIYINGKTGKRALTHEEAEYYSKL